MPRLNLANSVGNPRNTHSFTLRQETVTAPQAHLRKTKVGGVTWNATTWVSRSGLQLDRRVVVLQRPHGEGVLTKRANRLLRGARDGEGRDARHLRQRRRAADCTVVEERVAAK